MASQHRWRNRYGLVGHSLAWEGLSVTEIDREPMARVQSLDEAESTGFTVGTRFRSV